MSGSDGQLSAAGAARGASLVMELLAATLPTGAGAIARVSAAQRKPDTIPPAERERERESAAPDDVALHRDHSLGA